MEPKISLYLLKATEFCNLNCPYCYMFNLRDSAYKTKPKIMSLEVVDAVARKAVDLAVRQEVPKLTISIHGGEPLLAGMDWYRSTINKFRAVAGDDVQVVFTTQTNGIPLDREWLELLRENRVSVGLSMDGPKHIHDRYRVNFAGRGSYDDVIRGLNLLLEYPDVFGGVLCVMDPTTDGLEVYQHFRDLGVKSIDFLWPLEHNWDAPPPGYEEPDATPYADYLIPIFDHWWAVRDKEVKIRYFGQIIKNLFGARGGLDSLGGNPVTITSIDSDGGIEPVDSLKACGDHFTDMGLNVLRDPIEAIYDQFLFQQVIAGQDGLCAQCKECSLHDVCGGGYLPHRYSESQLFANPTVYCRDVWKLTMHILAAVRAVAQFPRSAGSSREAEPLRTIA